MANPVADFPTAVHTSTDVSAFTTSKLGSTVPTHTDLEGKQESEVVAVQTKIGTGSSTPTSGKVLRATGIGTSAWGAADLTTDVTGTLPVVNGGTGSTTAANARTALGLAIGTDVQAYDVDLTTWGGKTAPSGTVVGDTDTQSLTNKTLQDSTTYIADDLDATKKVQFQVSGLTTATTRTLTVPDADLTIVGTATAQTLTNKTITAPFGLVKGDVGLGNVDNTSDVGKPVSTAQQTALDLKTDKATLLAKGSIYAASAASTPAGLAVGTDGQVLTADSVQATGVKWATPSAGGGQTVFTKTVAPSGGDYTTVSAALAAASAGWSIGVQPGTYTEGGVINFALANVSIIGFDPENTVLSFGANTLSTTFAATNLTIKGVRFSFDAGKLSLSGANTTVKDCSFVKSAGTTSGQMIYSDGADLLIDNIYYSNPRTDNDSYQIGIYGAGSKLTNSNITVRVPNYGSTSMRGGVYFQANNCIVSGNKMNGGNGGGNESYTVLALYGNNTVCSGNNISFNAQNGGNCISLWSAYGMSITGNSLFTAVNGVFMVTDCNKNTISGNAMYDVKQGVEMDNGGYSCSFNTISGNQMFGQASNNGSAAVYLNNSGDNYNTITGNTMYEFQYTVNIVAGCNYNNITGNNFANVSTTRTTQGVNDAGNMNTTMNNQGDYHYNDKKFVRCYNNTAGSFSAGNVVVIVSSAAGNEINATTTLGDNKVFGMVCETIGAAAYGQVQVLGKTTLLKVNGTTAISIGDYLSTYSVAGIAAKALTTHTAFAIALEAYSMGDSNGVIDALIINPRYIA